MPACTAADLISLAFDTVGLYTLGQTTVPPDVMNGALTRLNLMMGSLSLQPLTKPVLAREVFPVTATVGAYTIGPTGDFATSRPTRLEGAGILLNSVGTPQTLTSLTRSGAIVTGTLTTHGYATGQNITIAGATPTAYNGTYTVTVTGANTFTYLLAGEVTSPATGTITASAESTTASTVEVPRALLTDDAWSAIQIKSLQAAQFTNVYYNATYAADLGSIYLWPIPTTNANSLVLYRFVQLSTFTNLTTTYFLPDGAQETLGYALARRLLTPFGVTDAATVADVIALADKTMADFKRANLELWDQAQDPAFTRDPSGGYNILTGVGGGSSI